MPQIPLRRPRSSLNCWPAKRRTKRKRRKKGQWIRFLVTLISSYHRASFSPRVTPRRSGTPTRKSLVPYMPRVVPLLTRGKGGGGEGGLGCMNQGSVLRALRRGRWLLVSDLFRGCRTWHGLLPPSPGSGQHSNDREKKESIPERPWWRTSMHQCHSRLIAPSQYTNRRPGSRDRTLRGQAELGRVLAWQICTTPYHNICLPRLRSHMSGLIFRLFFHCFPHVQRKFGRVPRRGGVRGACAYKHTRTQTHIRLQAHGHRHMNIYDYR